LLAQGRTPQALDAFAQTLALDATHDHARHSLVAALLRGKNNGEAERLLIERQTLAPRSAAFAMMLARLQAERGDNELALETLRASQHVAGANPAYYATTAALLARLGQHPQAIAQYQNALRLAPQSGVWWMGLGLSLQAQGSLPEAQEALRRARGSDNLPAELSAFVEQRLRQIQ
jgi:MSHA biogenesis protein MshN